MSSLTEEQIEEIVARIIRLRKNWVDIPNLERDVLYLKFNGIELEFTPDGVVWKRKQS